MTRADGKTLVVAAGAGLVVFLVGAWLWPAYDVEMVLVAMLVTAAVVGARSQGWKEWAGEMVFEGFFYLLLIWFWWAGTHGKP